MWTLFVKKQIEHSGQYTLVIFILQLFFLCYCLDAAYKGNLNYGNRRDAEYSREISHWPR
jgi:hypothetical protein